MEDSRHVGTGCCGNGAESPNAQPSDDRHGMELTEGCVSSWSVQRNLPAREESGGHPR